jgi:hypothetical protein
MTTETTRLDTALQSAFDAFWSEIGKAYPEAETGDISPCALMPFQDAARVAVTQWVQANATPPSSPEAGQGSPEIQHGASAPQALIELCRRLYEAADIAGEETDIDAAIEALEAAGSTDAGLHHSGGGNMHALAVVPVDGVPFFIVVHNESVEAFDAPPSADVYECWLAFYPSDANVTPLVRLSIP